MQQNFTYITDKGVFTMSKVKTKQFSGSHLDENGNIILEDVPMGKRKVKTREFADTVKVSDDVLIAMPKPEVDEYEEESETEG